MNVYGLASGAVFAYWVLEPYTRVREWPKAKYGPYVALVGCVGIPLLDRVLPTRLTETFYDNVLIGAVTDAIGLTSKTQKQRFFTDEQEIIEDALKRMSVLASVSMVMFLTEKYLLGEK